MENVVLDLAISSKENARKTISNWTRQKKDDKICPSKLKKKKLRCIRFSYLRETAALDFGTPPFGPSPQGNILILNSTRQKRTRNRCPQKLSKQIQLRSTSFRIPSQKKTGSLQSEKTVFSNSMRVIFFCNLH